MEKKIITIIFLVLLLTLPFINKAVHIDDVAFIYMAKQITKEPLKPYSFNLEVSSSSGLATHITDPPLGSYYMALIIYLFGEKEFILHLSYIIFPVIAAIGMYYIAKKFTDKAFYATLFLVSSVAFVVMQHNLMVDIVFLAYFLLSLAFFIYGTDSNKNHLLFFGAVFCGFAYLTKYSGLVVLFILALYPITRKKFKPLLYLLIPISIIAFWNIYTYLVYGMPHNFQILSWLFESQKSFSYQSTIVRLITNFTYLGGATIFPLMLLYPFIKYKKNKIAYFFVLAVSAILSFAIYFASGLFAYKYNFFQLLLFAFFFSTGMFFIFVILSYYYNFFREKFQSKDFFKKSSADIIFLFFWCIIIFVFNSTLAGGAVRYITALIPPLFILYFIILDKYKLIASENLGKFVYLGIALSLSLSLFVAIADYELAEAYKTYTKDLGIQIKDVKVWYLGHHGFQYYMDKQGFTILGINDNSPKKGDLIIKAKLPSPRKFSNELKERIEIIQTDFFKGKIVLKVQNPKARAGFYTYGGGFLPYSFSKSSLEEFEVYEVVK